MISSQSDSAVKSTVKQALLEKLRSTIVPQMERLVESLPEQLVDFGEAETMLRAGILKIARGLLEAWGQVADSAIERPCCPSCGVPMRHRGRCRVGLVTSLGDVAYRRPRWRCEGCGEERYPHDDLLRFPGHNVSWPLARLCGRLGAQLPSFDEATGNLAEDYGVRLAKETLRRIAEEAGNKVIEQEDALRQRLMDLEQPLPESERTPAKAYVFADGTTVHSDGDWHEVRVMTVVAADAEGRTLERRSLARFFGVDEVAWTLTMLARSVGYANVADPSQRAFIADGAAWLWKLQERYFGSAVAILDWYHLEEHVHKAANAVFGLGSVLAKATAKQLKEDLWEGRVVDAIARTRQELAMLRSPSKRDAWHELLTYLENNQKHMDYPRYRTLNLPIGSGQVEAQCKTLVGGRCKQAGMRDWTYAGAEGTLRMRAARQDGSFDDLWNAKLRLAA
jgi:hypothetical protein